MGKRKALLIRVSDVDLRLLRAFKTVVNCGGFSAAEIDLGIGRSTISTHIGELEARLVPGFANAAAAALRSRHAARKSTRPRSA